MSQKPNTSKNSTTTSYSKNQKHKKTLSLQQKQLVHMIGNEQKPPEKPNPLHHQSKSQHLSYKMNDHFPKSLRSSQYLSEQQKQLQEQFIVNFNMLQNHQEYDLKDTEEVQLFHQQEKRPQFMNNIQKQNTGLTSFELYAQNFIQMKKLDFYYFKVKVLSKLSPLNLIFKTQQKLKIYLSTEALFPSKFNSQFTVYAKAVKIHSENGQTFFEQFVYLSVHSDDEQNICIISHFGQQNKNSLKYSKYEKESRVNSQDEFSEKEYQRVIDKHNQMKLIKRKNIVQFNLNTKQYLRPLIEQENQKKLETCVKHQRQVYLRSKEVLVNKKTQLILDQNTVQCIRKYREYQKYNSNKKKQNYDLALKWVAILQLTQLTMQMTNRIKTQKFQKRNLNFGVLRARIFCERQLFKLKTCGQTAEQRCLTASKQIILHYLEQIEVKVKTQAINIISTFLQTTSVQLNFLHSYYSTVEKSLINYKQNSYHALSQIQVGQKNKESKHGQTLENYSQYCRGNNLCIVVDESTRKKFVRSQKFVVDVKVMGKIIDEHIKQKKIAWMEHYTSKKSQQLFLQLMDIKPQPKLYHFSDKDELQQIVREYAQAKFII